MKEVEFSSYKLWCFSFTQPIIYHGDYFPNFTNSSEFQIEMINDVIFNMVGPLISYLPRPQLVWRLLENGASSDNNGISCISILQDPGGGFIPLTHPTTRTKILVLEDSEN